MSWTRKVAAPVLLGAMGLGALWALGGGSVPLARASAAEPGAVSVTVTALSGERVPLASLRGKAVAVNFWAPWCPPCRHELPELAAFYRAHRDQCFELLGVAEDSGTAAEVGEAARAFGIPYPVMLDPGGLAARSLGATGLPHTVILDASGRVRRVFEGAIDRRTLEDALAPLLAAPGARCVT